METSGNLPRLVREFRQFFLVEIQSDARSIRYDHIPAVTLKRVIDNFVEGVSTGVALMREKVGDGCIELHKCGEVDRTAHQVWENAHKGGFSECRNFLAVRDATRQ